MAALLAPAPALVAAAFVLLPVVAVAVLGRFVGCHCLVLLWPPSYGSSAIVLLLAAPAPAAAAALLAPAPTLGVSSAGTDSLGSGLCSFGSSPPRDAAGGSGS